jgi:hypothetical protein
MKVNTYSLIIEEQNYPTLYVYFDGKKWYKGAWAKKKLLTQKPE